MSISVARMIRVSSAPVRAGYCGALAALLVLIGCETLQNATAEGDTRTISFHHIHTNEDLTITYKVNGRYDEEALQKINHELRDWRLEQTVKMDPHLIDVAAAVSGRLAAVGVGEVEVEAIQLGLLPRLEIRHTRQKTQLPGKRG